MSRIRDYVRQHHVGLIAIMLMVSGGTAYAVTAPKNSVASSSIKSGAVRSADIKDEAVRGKDIRDGTIDASDLAGNATDESQLFTAGLSPGQSAVVWEDPQIGTLNVGCGADFRSVTSFASLNLSPGAVGVRGIEHFGESAADTSFLVGAATVTRTSPAQPVGGVGFGGSGASFVDLAFHYETPTKRIFIDVRWTLCSIRADISIDHVGPDRTPPPRSLRRQEACVSTGNAYCGARMRA